MDVQSLRDNYPKLISRMEASGYSACYVSKLKREINRILSSADSKCWTSYSDIYLEYSQTSSSPSYLRNKLTFLGIIEHFDVRGQYPNGQRRQKLVERGKYHLLAQEFKSVIDCYCAVERLRGKKEATIYVESHSAASFLFALQQSGIDTVEKITEEAVLSVFLSEDGSLCRSCSYKKNVAAVFKACIRALKGVQKLLDLGLLSVGRSEEFQADAYAKSVGFGPGLVSFLSRMQYIEKAPDGLWAALSRTHPLTAERIRRLNVD
jgi:hypothetical protein